MTVRITDLNQPQPAKAPGNFKISAEHRRLVAQTCEYIKSNLGQKLTLDVLAARVGYSRSHFSRMFRRTVGQDAYSYTTDLRMKAAATLLADTDLTVLAIMHQVGYHSTGAFAGAFHAHHGETPARYRRRREGDRLVNQR